MDFYTFQPVKMNRNILTNILPVQMGKRVVIVDNTAHKIRGKFGLWEVKGWINGLVHDCWVKAKIRSLPEVKLPLFGEFETPTDKLTKTLLYEWGTARLELDVLLGDSLGNWGSFGESAIKNSNGYRYRKHRVMDLMTDNPGFTLEENFKIAVQLINVGFGDLTSSDQINIVGSWTQEFVSIQPQPPAVINNLYGGSGTATPIPTSNAVLVLTLTSGNVAYIGSGTLININLSKATPSTTYTATWRKEGTLTSLTMSFTSDSSGNVTANYDSVNFASLGAGKYTLELTDNTKTITSNEINTVTPSLVVSPTTAYNWSSSTISVAVSGLSLNTTYTLEFINVSGTSASRTQTAETTTFTFAGNLFTPGTYRAKLTKGALTVTSNEILINLAPTFTLTTTRSNIGYYIEDTPLSFRASNLLKSSALTYQWLKNNVSVNTGQGITDANGEWLGTIGCTALQNSPYGEGTYKLKVTQGTTEVISSSIETRSFKFRSAISSYQEVGSQISVDIIGLPVGSTFTYTLLKGGVAQGSAVSQTFTYADTFNLYHRVTLNTTTIANTYGLASNYSVRVTFNNVSITTNTFSINEAVYSPG